MRLPAGLLQRKFRAIECHLHGLAPSRDDDDVDVGISTLSSADSSTESKKQLRRRPRKWSRESRLFFVDRVKDKRLVVQVKALMMEGEPLVDLWDTTPGLKALETSSKTPLSADDDCAEDVLLNELLVKRGFAVFADDSC